MCLGGGSSALPPPPPPPVAPPPPPPQITVAPPPQLAMVEPLKNLQARPDNPIRKRRGTSRRGKAMLKIPMNASGGTVNL